ncbi:MAG: putative sensor histidine kinase with and Response regulator receiver domain [Tardiphaga sp.]|nr:putative sensor histidine kinase with and Response regulator receiver domain [Tardiphaga sp.]
MQEGDERGVFFSNRPIGSRDRRLAIVVVIFSTLVFGMAAPFAKMQLPAAPAFIASYQSALAINDLITAVLLFAQFGVLRARALLWLASGYLFTAAVAIVHALTFPGLFAPSGLFNAGLQTTAWLYMLWHAGFPLFVLAYALLKQRKGEIEGSVHGAIAASVIAVGIAVSVLALVVTGGHDFLPGLLRDGRYAPTMIGIITSVWLLSVAALVALWFRRPHSTLDVWLMVVMCAWLFDIALSAIVNETRFDLGFYVGRIYGLFAASFVLAMLLIESVAQQMQLSGLLVTERQQGVAEIDRFRERERLFSAAVESSNDAIVTKTLDGVITGWNKAAENLFGYSADKAIGRSIDIIVPDGLRGEMRKILDQVRGGAAIKNYETVRVSKDGRAIDISLSVSPVKSQSGQIVGATQIARDVSETRKTQVALGRETEERHRIFETSQDLILVTDPKGNFVQVSPSSASILGYQPEEMIGYSATQFIHRDDLESTRDEMRSARRGRGMRNFVTRYVHRDGRSVSLTWMGTWSEPVQRHFFIGRDMTEIQLAQEALLDSERMARRIIETALDAFVQMDDEGAVTDWNSQAEKIFGWSRAEAVGRTLTDLIVPEMHRARHNEGMARFLRTGEGPILGTRFEIEARRRDGKDIKVEVSITAIQRRDRHVFNGFIRDLTDKIAAETQIRQAQKMDAIGQLTGGVAHDFNNILTVITGTIEILAEGVTDRPDLAAVAKMIDEAAERGADLTKHLLAFARLQPLQPREIDVNALVVTAGKLLRPTLGEHIEIEMVLADDPWLAFVDSGQLTTAILNLALNARDAMPQGGKLILETQNSNLDEGYAGQNSEVKSGQYVLIAISDTGSGIPADLLDKVFEPFFTTKELGRGTGLGLSMVYGFVKQSGGHIKVYSEQGHGTTIKLYLPRSAEASQNPTEEAKAEVAAGGTELILVVEDDALVRNHVVAQVRSLGYRTLSAANADEALRVIHSNPAIDLLFTDVIMPGLMNGRQLAIEASKIRIGLKVLYTSGYTENAIVHHGRLDPGVLLLAKPYRKADLARMIRMAIDGAGGQG